METYAQALLVAIPFFAILVLVEAIAAYRMKVRVNRGVDMIASLSSGVTNIIKDVLGLSIAIVSYAWLADRIAIYEIEATWLTYFIAFMVIDFAGYWMHRLNHEVNVLWNRHIIHHSSEEFNLSCALRQSISTFFPFIAIFMIPAALLGVPNEVVVYTSAIHLFAQFWYHTRLINKMSFLELFLVTPSHHRVHHAMNDIYLDKNYGQIFIFWDRLFGTFQEELDDMTPVYGVKRPVRSWNPFLINFQHVYLLATDSIRTKYWKDKAILWFKPTGWRPADVAEKYPIELVSDLSNFEKFDTKPSRGLLAWSWAQLVVTLGLMFYLFAQFGDIGFPNVLLYGGFLFWSVFSYTALLDKSSWAPVAELIRAGMGLGLIYWMGGSWFGMEAFLPIASYLLATYFIISVGVVWWYHQRKGEAK